MVASHSAPKIQERFEKLLLHKVKRIVIEKLSFGRISFLNMVITEKVASKHYSMSGNFGELSWVLVKKTGTFCE